MEWKWLNKAKEYDIDGSKVVMVAGEHTDLFNAPGGDFTCDNFPYMYIEYEGDFTVTCKVLPEFLTMHDLGSIVVWDNKDTWVKLAYETTDNGSPAIVSVVTRQYSDDCNGPIADGKVWLQISRKGDLFALHYSTDGINWLLTRICSVPMSSKVKVGISAQSPIGEQCRVVFEDFMIKPNNYSDLRKAK